MTTLVALLRLRKETPMTRILAPAAAILTGALLGLIAVWVWLATVSLDIPVPEPSSRPVANPS